LVTDFNTPSSWNITTGWSIANGKATGVATSTWIDQDNLLTTTIGKTYRVEIQSGDITSGSVNVRFKDPQSNYFIFIDRSNSIFTYDFVRIGSDRIQLYGINFSGEILSVSIKEVTGVVSNPVIVSGEIGAINNQTIELTFSESLASGNTDGTHTISASGGAVTGTPSIVGGKLRMALSRVIASNETISYSYINSGLNPLQDSSADQVLDTSNLIVTNNILPSFVSAEIGNIDNVTIEATFSSDLMPDYHSGIYGVVATNGNPNVVSSSINNGKLRVILDRSITESETITLNYTSSGTTPLQDETGKLLPNLTNESITNNISPSLGSELVDDGDLTTPGSDWELQTGWELTGGKAVATDCSLSMKRNNIAMLAGKSYRVSFDAVATSGACSVRLAVPTSGEYFVVANTTQSYSYDIINVGGQTSLQFYGSSFTGEIDNVSVKEIPGTPIINVNFSSASGGSPNKSVIDVIFDDLLSGLYTNGTYTLVGSSGSISVTPSIVNGNLRLVTSRDIIYGETLTLSYSNDGLSDCLQNSSGIKVASFTNQSVTNNVPSGSPVEYIHVSTWEDGLLGNWRINNYGAASSITEIVDTHSRTGSKSLKLEAKDDYRNEIILQEAPEGLFYDHQEYWLGQSIYLENWSYPYLAWTTIMQTHTVPGNQNWNCWTPPNCWTLGTGHGANKTDPLLLRFNIWHPDNFDPNTIPPTTAASGPDRLFEGYLSDWENQWIDFVLNFIPSSESDGKIRVWMNGVMIGDIRGHNLFLLDGCGMVRDPFVYYQTGIYKAREQTDVKRVMYIDNVRITGADGSYDAVNPAVA
jgi:hypothetical protein